jgi:hypothetical protein
MELDDLAFDACPIGMESDYIGGGKTPLKVINLDDAKDILKQKFNEKCESGK